MAPRPEEVAVLIVNGQKFRDWTLVTVETRITEYYPIATFECTEQVPIPSAIVKAQIKPGDVCQVALAGELVFSGYVIQRQVSYDRKNHMVRIVATGKTKDLTETSVFSESGSYDGQSWLQFAQALVGPSGIGVRVLGNIDSAPFENIHVNPGELKAQALERYARMRRIILGSTPLGDLLAIGEHKAVMQDALIEGVNIESAQIIISDEYVYKRIYSIGQNSGNDTHNGDEANKGIAAADGSSTRNRVLVVPSEVADTQHGLQQRANIELNFSEGAKITANITVTGWVRSSGKLWHAGDYYWVRTPMGMLDQLLGCRCCTYSQNNGEGTETTLEMVDPFHMNGRPDFSGPTPSG